MTENLLQKLEEKMMVLLTELEDSRKDIQRLNNENSTLKLEKESFQTERQTYSKKLLGLLELLDSITETNPISENAMVSAMKPEAFLSVCE